MTNDNHKVAPNPIEADDVVLVKSTDGILQLTLNRPSRKNALNFAMYRLLTQQLQQAEQDSTIKVVILAGAGGAFTSGNDLEDFARGAELDPSESPIVQFMLTLLNFPKPMIVAVDGLAVGIGTTLLLHVDFVYASERSEFRLPFTQLGLCPEYGSSYVLPQLVGHVKASEWLMLGASIRAQEALQAQMINAVVDDPEAMAYATAQQLVRLPPAALRRTKALLKAPFKSALNEVVRTEIEAFSDGLRGPEFAEAVAAFFAKRPPDFSGFH